MDWLTWGLLAIHLACVNHAAAGPLTLLWAVGRRPLSEPLRRAGQGVIRSVTLALLAGMLLGLVLMTVHAYQHPVPWQKLWLQFRFKLFWGVGQIATFLAAWWWAGKLWSRRPPTAPPGWLFSLLAWFAATNLLYHFPPLFTLIGIARQQQLETTSPLTPSEFRQAVFEPQVASLWLHVLLASVATASVVVARYGYRSRDEQPIAELAGWTRRSMILSTATTALQLPVGIWVVASLPPGLQGRLLGGDWWLMSLLGAGMMATLVLLNQTSEALWVVPTKKSVDRSLLWLGLVLVLMTGALVRLRGTG